MITELCCQQWHDLDWLLVQFWASHSIRPRVTYQAEVIKNDIGYYALSLLPELTRRGSSTWSSTNVNRDSGVTVAAVSRKNIYSLYPVSLWFLVSKICNCVFSPLRGLFVQTNGRNSAAVNCPPNEQHAVRYSSGFWEQLVPRLCQGEARCSWLVGVELGPGFSERGV